MRELEYDTAHELLDYNPNTGDFTWKRRSGTGRAISTFNAIFPGKIAGSFDANGYRVLVINRRSFLAHRIAFLMMTGGNALAQIDHINGQPSDNRWVNLRLASAAENARNAKMQHNNTSGFPGVSRHWRDGKWEVWHRQKYHGRFVDLDTAIATKTSLMERDFGEFNPLNR